MANGNQQRCCVLGVCCAPGGAAQREALKAWLVAKIEEHQHFSKKVVPTEQEIEGWLDELFAADDPAAAEPGSPTA